MIVVTAPTGQIGRQVAPSRPATVIPIPSNRLATFYPHRSPSWSSQQNRLTETFIEGGRATGIEPTDGRTVRAGQFVASTLDTHQTFETLVGCDQMPANFAAKVGSFQYTSWTLFGVRYALKETPRFYAEKFNPNIARTQKWNTGAETMSDLKAAHEDVQAVRVPDIIQFGSGALNCRVCCTR